MSQGRLNLLLNLLFFMMHEIFLDDPNSAALWHALTCGKTYCILWHRSNEGFEKNELAVFLKRYAIDDSISFNTKEAMEAYARYARASGIVIINIFVLNFSQFFNGGFVL